MQSRLSDLGGMCSIRQKPILTSGGADSAAQEEKTMKKVLLSTLAAMMLCLGMGTIAQADDDRRYDNSRYRRHHYAPRSHGYYPRPGPGPRVYYRGYTRRPYGYSYYGPHHRTQRGIYIRLF
jgi:hypothetical protein